MKDPAREARQIQECIVAKDKKILVETILYACQRHMLLWNISHACWSASLSLTGHVNEAWASSRPVNKVDHTVTAPLLLQSSFMCARLWITTTAQRHTLTHMQRFKLIRSLRFFWRTLSPTRCRYSVPTYLTTHIVNLSSIYALKLILSRLRHTLSKLITAVSLNLLWTVRRKFGAFLLCDLGPAFELRFSRNFNCAFGAGGICDLPIIFWYAFKCDLPTCSVLLQSVLIAHTSAEPKKIDEVDRSRWNAHYTKRSDR